MATFTFGHEADEALLSLKAFYGTDTAAETVQRSLALALEAVKHSVIDDGHRVVRVVKHDGSIVSLIVDS